MKSRSYSVLTRSVGSVVAVAQSAGAAGFATSSLVGVAGAGAAAGVGANRYMNGED